MYRFANLSLVSGVWRTRGKKITADNLYFYNFKNWISSVIVWIEDYCACTSNRLFQSRSSDVKINLCSIALLSFLLLHRVLLLVRSMSHCHWIPLTYTQTGGKYMYKKGRRPLDKLKTESSNDSWKVKYKVINVCPYCPKQSSCNCYKIIDMSVYNAAGVECLFSLT